MPVIQMNPCWANEENAITLAKVHTRAFFAEAAAMVAASGFRAKFGGGCGMTSGHDLLARYRVLSDRIIDDQSAIIRRFHLRSRDRIHMVRVHALFDRCLVEVGRIIRAEIVRLTTLGPGGRGIWFC